MKITLVRSILLLLLLLCGHESYSQTEKGKFLIGGQYLLNYSSNIASFVGQSNSYEFGRYRTLAISPHAGYFIVDNVSCGLELIYSFAWTSNGQASSHSYSYTFVPFVRYYIGNYMIKPYVQGGAGPGLSRGVANEYGNKSSDKSKLFRYELTAGLCSFINQSVSIDIGVSYNSTAVTNNYNTTAGTFLSKYINKNMEAFAGFVVCF